MLLISLTGPSGAGKNEFARLLEARGVPQIDCDALTHDVYAPGSPCLRELAAAFGADILRADGALDRAQLAARAFAAPEKTDRLNAITHRHILAEIDRRAAKLAAQGCRAVCVNGATLIESGFAARSGLRIAVTADRETRLARVLARDGLSREAAERRFSAQKDDAFYTENADLTVDNSGSPAALAAAADRAAELIRTQGA